METFVGRIPIYSLGEHLISRTKEGTRNISSSTPSIAALHERANFKENDALDSVSVSMVAFPDLGKRSVLSFLTSNLQASTFDSEVGILQLASKIGKML